jgi:steroid delta-isomerase-like uncharacterized protein
MSIEDNKIVARRFLQIWGNGSLDIIDELASPSISVYYPIAQRVMNGSIEFKKVMTNFRAAFHDSSIKIDDEVAEGDKVVIRWTFSATHHGNFLSLPPSGKKIKWTGITIYHIISGKVVEERGEEDFLGFLRQIGMVKM